MKKPSRGVLQCRRRSRKPVNDTAWKCEPECTPRRGRKPKDFETKPLEEFCKCLSDQKIRSLLPLPVRILSHHPYEFRNRTKEWGRTDANSRRGWGNGGGQRKAVRRFLGAQASSASSALASCKSFVSNPSVNQS